MGTISYHARFTGNFGWKMFGSRFAIFHKLSPIEICYQGETNRVITCLKVIVQSYDILTFPLLPGAVKNVRRI